MPLKTEIQAIVATLPGNCTFLFGTANEVNRTADDAEREPPIIAMYPKQPISSNVGVNGSVHNEYNMYIEFLFIHDFDNDTVDCEPLVSRAIVLHNQFLLKLYQFRAANGGRYFKLAPRQRFNAMPVYNKHDANTCGVSLTIRLEKRYDELLLGC